MLLTGYAKRIMRAECNPHFEALHVIASLDEDISQVLPYLNTALGGSRYLKDPPEIMFQAHGKLIKVGGREIAVNALKDEDEADKILTWLKNEINQAWDDRENIEPSTKGAAQPQVMEILKLLPRTNCRDCGQPTCMVFAVQMAEGVRAGADCPGLGVSGAEQIDAYLGGFGIDQGL